MDLGRQVMRLSRLERIRIGLEIGVATVIAVLTVVVLPLVLDTFAGTGRVFVTGEYRGTTIIRIGTQSVSFVKGAEAAGPGVDPGDQVVAFSNARGTATCYVWTGLDGGGNRVVVESSRPWMGYIRAVQDESTPVLDIGEGHLGFGTRIPRDYTQCSSTDFIPLGEEDFRWQDSGTRGRNSYIHYYSLTLEGTGDPGTFKANLVYTVYPY